MKKYNKFIFSCPRCNRVFVTKDYKNKICSYCKRKDKELYINEKQFKVSCHIFYLIGKNDATEKDFEEEFNALIKMCKRRKTKCKQK